MINMEESGVRIIQQEVDDDSALYVYEDEEGTLQAEYIQLPDAAFAWDDPAKLSAKAEVYRWNVYDDPVNDLNLSDSDIRGISSYIGLSPGEFRKGSPVDIYRAYGDYHGFVNLDQYPILMTRLELRDRWPTDFSDLDPDSMIAGALDEALNREANVEAAAHTSMEDEMKILDLAREGWDTTEYVSMAVFGDAGGIRGEGCSAQAVYSAMEDARRDGLKQVPGGTMWPGGEHTELLARHIIASVASDLDIPQKLVGEVLGDVYANEISGDLIYWDSKSGDIYSYARPPRNA